MRRKRWRRYKKLRENLFLKGDTFNLIEKIKEKFFAHYLRSHAISMITLDKIIGKVSPYLI